jgi:SsrA-binding protein
MAKTAKTSKPHDSTVAFNRKALHDYLVLDRIEAGIVLTGTEIKAIREGRANIREAYARPENDEMFLYNAHIAQYSQGNRYNHDPARTRKLLLHKKQIRELRHQLEAKGLTVVPLRLYLKNGKAKLELAVARGKRQYDRRAAIKERDVDRQLARALRRSA